MRAIEACHVNIAILSKRSERGKHVERFLRIQQAVHDMGCPRVATDVRIGTRTDKSSSHEHKRKAVEDYLAKN